MPRPWSLMVIEPRSATDDDLDNGRDASLFRFVERVIDALLEDDQRPVRDRVADLLHKLALRHKFGEARDRERLPLQHFFRHRRRPVRRSS